MDKLYAVENLLGLKHFYLPRIPCSIPAHPPHPDAAYASKVSHEWAFQFLDPELSDAKKKALRDWDLPFFMNLLVPFGSTKSAVVCGKFSWYASLVDDGVDEGFVSSNILQEYYTSILGHFRNPKKKIQASDEQLPIRIFRATEDFVPLLRSSMFPSVYDRFVSRFERYTQTRVMERPKVSSIAEYIEWRRVEIFLDPCFSFIEMGLKTEISDADMESEEYLTVRDAAIDYVTYVNDTLSFAKEYACDKLLNLPVLVLLSDSKVNTLQDAIDNTLETTLEKEKEFIYYHDILLTKARAVENHEFVKYLEYLSIAVSNTVQYHNTSARYNPFYGMGDFDGNWNLDFIKDARGRYR